ncbi:helix-turn-helix domain-containing protein [Bifidobacterium simiarum]|uniref:helix-turn-helix domain-containing protein n=1 Tax=Bifidobacterium simiarum TaxID=2045441 RepID=UPI001BDC29B2|nr:helix-turn-helix transcriptional regulator [Bifidobacterium simiarum]MBT1167006.1 helix-turn-helix domain-containing protein [Bifidobacterium simiarum]
MRINEVVGRFLKDYRDEHGLTLENIATASRKYGSGWSAAKIRDIERGGGNADSLAVMIVLVQALNDLTGDDMALADLFRYADGTWRYFPVELTDVATIPSTEMRAILRGDEVQLATTRPLPGIEAVSNLFVEYFGMPPFRDEEERRAAADHVPTFAEQRAAKRIGVNVRAFGAWCIHLYGRSLDEEATARAGDGATPQKRGRCTRGITDEIKTAMDGEQFGQRE